MVKSSNQLLKINQKLVSVVGKPVRVNNGYFFFFTISQIYKVLHVCCKISETILRLICLLVAYNLGVKEFSTAMKIFSMDSPEAEVKFK